MKIQVLGSGCPTCKNLYEIVQKAVGCSFCRAPGRAALCQFGRSHSDYRSFG